MICGDDMEPIDQLKDGTEQLLEFAQNKTGDGSREGKLMIQGEIEAYRNVLNLLAFVVKKKEPYPGTNYSWKE